MLNNQLRLKFQIDTLVDDVTLPRKLNERIFVPFCFHFFFYVFFLSGKFSHLNFPHFSLSEKIHFHAQLKLSWGNFDAFYFCLCNDYFLLICKGGRMITMNMLVAMELRLKIQQKYFFFVLILLVDAHSNCLL